MSTASNLSKSNSLEIGAYNNWNLLTDQWEILPSYFDCCN